MSLDPQPLQDHGEGFFTWHAFDPACKAELWSTAFFGPENTILFDPIEWPKVTAKPKAPILIVQTNGNHDRECKNLVQLFKGQTSKEVPSFQAIPLPGAGEMETAYFHGTTGTLVVGDALINLSPHPLMLLPEKYCSDSNLLRTSLAQLLSLPIQRIFFAHGAPILQDGLNQIQRLLA